MNTRKYTGKIVKVYPKKQVIELELDNGRCIAVHKNEILRPNPYLNEMSWENLLQRKYATFWALEVPEYERGVKTFEIQEDKLEYWYSRPVEIEADGISSIAGQAARSTHAKIKARYPVSIEDFDRVLQVCIAIGRYDLAYTLAKQLYTGAATQLRSEQIQFRKYPGPKGVLIQKPTRGKLYQIFQVPDGLASEVIYTWWALHGGWHHHGELWEAMDYNRVMASSNNPWLIAGVPYYTMEELRSINKDSGARIIAPTGLRKEHLGTNKYGVFDNVVYVKDGPSMHPLGFAHPELDAPEYTRRQAWDLKWCEQEMEKLKLNDWTRKFFRKKHEANLARITTNATASTA